MKVFEITESKNVCSECGKPSWRTLGMTVEQIEEGERHGNSKMYDKCWKGYRKVPGKKRGEPGSCKKISEDATAGATSSGNIASVANPRAAYAKIKRDKNGVPVAPQRKNSDGTTQNALDNDDTLMASAKPKTIKRTS